MLDVEKNISTKRAPYTSALFREGYMSGKAFTYLLYVYTSIWWQANGKEKWGTVPSV